MFGKPICYHKWKPRNMNIFFKQKYETFFFTQSNLNSNLYLTNHSIIVNNTNLFYFSVSTDFFQPIGIGYKMHVNIVIIMIEQIF